MKRYTLTPLCSLTTLWNQYVLSECSKEIIVYIAGFVSRRLQILIKCERCIQSLIGEKDNYLYSLISQKNRGGLTYPSEDLIKVCKISEHFLRLATGVLDKKILLKR